MKVELVETSLRQGQQILLLSRLRNRHLIPVVEKLDRCGFAALDVFGGATFEASLRFLGEDPFERLRAVRAAAPNTKLLALIRGQALVGHRQYPDDVVDAFIKVAAEDGIDIFRCYDSLNDVRNLRRCVKAIHAVKKHAEGAIVYTESPAHSAEKFAAFGAELAGMGFDSVCIYDPTGLLGAGTAADLVERLRSATRLPVALHCAAATGQTGLAYLAALEKGAASLDVALSPLSGGTSLPATEGIIHALEGTAFASAIDRDAVAVATSELEQHIPWYRDIEDARAWRSDATVLRSKVPAATLDNIVTELRERNAADKFPAVIEEIAQVRQELGFPPLITPIAHIVAMQAVYNVIGGDRYATISQEVKDYCLGLYGTPPAPLDPDVLRIVNGRDEPITCRPADLLDAALPHVRRELKREKIDADDATVVTYALFPAETIALRKNESVVERLGDEGDERVADIAEATVPSSAVTSAPVVADIPDEVRELTVEVEGEKYSVRVIAPAGTFGGDGNAARSTSSAPASTKEGVVTAPMQGLILKIAVKVGDVVRLGDVVAVLEAMKMQNDIVATHGGKVQDIFVTEGVVVSPRDPIVFIA